MKNSNTTKLSYDPVLTGLTCAYNELLNVEKQINKKLAGAYVKDNTFVQFEKKFISQLKEIQCYDCNSEYTRTQIEKLIGIVEERGIRKPETVRKLFAVKKNTETVISR